MKVIVEPYVANHGRVFCDDEWHLRGYAGVGSGIWDGPDAHSELGRVELRRTQDDDLRGRFYVTGSREMENGQLVPVLEGDFELENRTRGEVAELLIMIIEQAWPDAEVRLPNYLLFADEPYGDLDDDGEDLDDDGEDE